MRIKVISLWHPHAWAMSQGVKKRETRGKEFIALPGVRTYRGPLGIHAAKKKFDPLDYHPKLCRQLAKDGLKSPEGLAYGAMLCVVDLVDIAPTEQVRGSLDARELLYGDYSDGRFVLETTNLRQLDVPNPVVGHQGLFYWNVPSHVAEKMSLASCEGVWDPNDSKNALCQNAGMEWHIQGLGAVSVRLCNECYQQAKRVHPGVTFQYAGRQAEVVA